jgi:DNA-binding CsgD family transcriptional regulator
MTIDTKLMLLTILERLSQNGFSIGVSFGETGPHWVHSTYSRPWVEHYVKRGFLEKDPTIWHGLEHSGHFLWSDLARQYPDSPIFSDAKNFGMSEGNTLSLNLNGTTTIASCAGPAWSEEMRRDALAAVAGLHFLHAPNTAPPNVPSGTLDVLKQMERGLRDQEIADELGVKVETVRKRRATGLDATSTKTAYQLLSFSIRNGCI